MATFTYSADNAFLTLNGFPINGLQEGSEISITMDEDVEKVYHFYKMLISLNFHKM
jgi:hypothetical protein